MDGRDIIGDDAARSDFVILCAAPRSGTTVLGEAVSRAYEAAWPQEIFNSAHAFPSTSVPYDYKTAWRQVRGNFFRFQEDALREDPIISYPTHENRLALFTRYLDQQRTTFPEKRFLLDIKYTSWHHLDTYWRLPGDSPGLIKIVRELGIPVIHLVRDNVFATYCSLKIAQSSGIWTQGDELKGPKQIAIDLHDCAAWMAQMHRTKALFSYWLDDHKAFSLSYERMLTPEQFLLDAEEAFSAAFQCPPSLPLEFAQQKIVTNLAERILNADELRAFFKDTEFERMVEEALQ